MCVICAGVNHSERKGAGLCHVSTQRTVHSHHGRGIVLYQYVETQMAAFEVHNTEF